jgi:hypothetical protein
VIEPEPEQRLRNACEQRLRNAWTLGKLLALTPDQRDAPHALRDRFG